MWFEDIALNQRHILGSHSFTEDEIVTFARKYDPQPFHIDAEAAKHSLYGGIIASGWLTAGIWMRLMVDAGLTRTADGAPARGGVSPGFEDMRWSRPVRPGTTLIYSTEAIEKVDLKSRPEFGLLRSRNEGRDGTDALYFSFIGKVFVPRRPKGEAT